MNITTHYTIKDVHDQFYQNNKNNIPIFTQNPEEALIFENEQQAEVQIEALKDFQLYLVPRTVSEVIFLKVTGELQKFTRKKIEHELHADDIEEHQMELRFGWVHEDQSTFSIKVKVKEQNEEKITLECDLHDYFNPKGNQSKVIQTTIKEMEQELLQNLINLVKIN